MSFGKLRFSYGTTGNDQIGDYFMIPTVQLVLIIRHNWVTTYTTLQCRLWMGTNQTRISFRNWFFKDRIFSTLALYRNRQLVGILCQLQQVLSLNANLMLPLKIQVLNFP
jgi:hypothetical protein